MIRRILLGIGALVVAVVLLLASLPWWFGVALRTWGGSHGLRFASYERLSYDRFVLHKAVFVRKTTEVKADRVEIDTPLWWYLERLRGNPSAVTVGTWSVAVSPNPNAVPDEATAMGWNELHAQLLAIATLLDHWLPRAEIGAGNVNWPGGGLTLQRASWQKRELTAKDLALLNRLGDVTIALPADKPIGIRATVVKEKLQLDALWMPERMEGKIVYEDQPVVGSASFVSHHWRAQSLALHAEHWQFPGARFGIGQVYSQLSGKADFNWRETAFSLDVTASGVPSDSKLPALQAVARARGDLARVSVEKLELNGAGFHATLSDPVVINRSGQLESKPSHFTLEGDIGTLSKELAKGKARGEVTIAATDEKKAKIDFQFHITASQFQKVAVSMLELRGELLGQKLTLDQLHAEFSPGNGVDLKGSGDIGTQVLATTQISGHLDRGFFDLWARSLPAFAAVVFKTEVSGPLAHLAHHGHAEVSDVETLKTRSAALTADWTGEGTRISDFTVKAQTAHGRCELQGSLDPSVLTLAHIRLFHENGLAFESNETARLSWSPGLTLSGFQLNGPSGHIVIDARSGADGHVQVEAKDLRSEWLNDFVEIPVTDGIVRNFVLNGQWKEGPMTFSSTLDFEVPFTKEQSAHLSLGARGDEKGVVIDHIRVGQAQEIALTAQGALPMTISPAAPELIHLDPNAKIQAHLATEPNGPLWGLVASLSGVKLVDPHTSIDITGSLNAPVGNLQVLVTRVQPDEKRWPKIPEITDLRARLSATRSAITMDELTFKVDGQALNLSGKLPAEGDFWKTAIENPRRVDWKTAEAKLEIPETDLAVLSRRYPQYLAPKGRVSATVTLAKGMNLQGDIRVTDAASRPLGSIGVLQDVSADVEFAGTKATLKEVTARLGGQPVTLTGTADLSSITSPRLEITARGQNVSLVRQAGLIIRTDFDLAIKTDEHSNTLVTGQVKLRDSLFLADVRSVVTGGERSVSQRPPYFSVDTEPFRHWELGIDISGERFMRLQTTVFSGVASARFRLDGTLGEPRAIGEVTINEGQVLFPFASFNVDRGSVRLLPDNPYEPRLSINGSARRYDFDVQMELTGTASDPRLSFSSNPPLESEQVLLMVMAGEIPRTDFSQTNQQRLTNIGVYLGQSLISNSGGGAGKADRLAFTSGERISTEGKETYTIEYKLNDRFSLVGEYDEFDDYNAGVKWHILQGNGKGEK